MASDLTSSQGLAELVATLRQTDAALAAQAAKAVNLCLTLRNWCFGCYLTEFEQNGADRAQYGARLIEEVSTRLQHSGVAPRSLRQYRQFYLSYPNLWQTASAHVQPLQSLLPDTIRQTLSAKSATLPGADTSRPSAPVQTLLERLSFSHFVELLQLDDPLQRSFYEVETLRGHWSVRELKRQIATQYYQRSGLSRQQAALSAHAHAGAETATAQQVIRDPYVFEFLGLKPQEVLIELKNDAFQHEHLGQLNAYVSYYRKHQMTEGDQPPIGILLCTRKNEELVEYALAGMSNQLFVSRYQVQLPAKDQMAAFLHQAVSELVGNPEP